MQCSIFREDLISVNIDIDKFRKYDLWFVDFKPDVDITISSVKDNTNEGILTSIKRLFMELQLGIAIDRFIRHDPLMSKVLEANVFYVSKTKKKCLLKEGIAKYYPDIDPSFRTMRINLKGDVFILIEIKKISPNADTLKPSKEFIYSCWYTQQLLKDVIEVSIPRNAIRRFYRMYWQG